MADEALRVAVAEERSRSDRLDRRVEAHIFVAFLAYCLQVTLKNRLQIHATGLTPTAALDKLATIQLSPTTFLRSN